MTNGSLAIFDSDIHYLHHLSEYLRARDDFPYDIIVFSDLDALNKSNLKSIDILITSVIPDFINDIDIGSIFYLTTDSISTYENYICLYKFQSADNIIRKIMENTKPPSNSISSLYEQDTSIIGIYSPVNGCGKTSFAISLGCVLSETAPTLLLSFDSFSILHNFANQYPFKDISDLLFYFIESPDTFRNKLLALTYKFSELNFLCPPATTERTQSIASDLWCELISAISHQGLYKYIIIDFSNLFLNEPEVLHLCSTIFMPQVPNYPALHKIDAFFTYLSYTSDLDSTLFNQITLPEYEDISSETSYIHWLTVGSMYTFSKNQISSIQICTGGLKQ